MTSGPFRDPAPERALIRHSSIPGVLRRLRARLRTAGARLRGTAIAVAFVPLLGATLSGFPPPVVIIYPFAAGGGTVANAGSDLATLLATKLAELGGLTLKPSTPGTDRADYSTAAAAAGADYYVSGYLTPVGSDVSLVAQVVSVRSGSIVFSTTALVRTYAEAAEQADTLRAAILRHAGRSLAALDAPVPSASAAPQAAPSGAAATIDVRRPLGRSRRAQPSAAPAAAPAPSAAVAATPDAVVAAATAAPAVTAPSAAASAAGGVLVMPAVGAGDVAIRSIGTQAVVAAFLAEGRPAHGYVPPRDGRIPEIRGLCAQAPDTALIVAPTLALANAGDVARAAVDLKSFDCRGALGPVSAARAAGRAGAADAVGRAAAAAVARLKLAS